ncbi:MAG: hypothetical protein JWQ23_1670 [Herminiimonas sp.]|nr:hypothetical protein [Herminiimonas sp.]
MSKNRDRRGGAGKCGGAEQTTTAAWLAARTANPPLHLSELLHHGFGIRYFKLAGCFDIELFHDAVIDQHRVTL